MKFRNLDLLIVEVGLTYGGPLGLFHNLEFDLQQRGEDHADEIAVFESVAGNVPGTNRHLEVVTFGLSTSVLYSVVRVMMDRAWRRLAERAGITGSG